ncbi:MAG: hypothetical protein IPP15_19835 [Saprospiraceae bacterium]|uniref:Uncharacterized protein n=1 Tax=Candidatus Opimibacter skivensis TaxID=2982028 RepID=A0A9D7XVE0_9BACT|nr:hypothetical protein [Candidatus Opimibacter skivensis]
MLTTFTHSFRTTLLFFCFLSVFSEIKSQCNPPDQVPTVTCDSAPMFCLVDYCAASLNVPQVCCINFCGSNTIVNNPQYFQFIPTAADVEIDIHVDNCSSGNGLQSAIVSRCNWSPCPGGSVPCPDVLACNPGAPKNSNDSAGFRTYRRTTILASD